MFRKTCPYLNHPQRVYRVLADDPTSRVGPVTPSSWPATQRNLRRNKAVPSRTRQGLTSSITGWFWMVNFWVTSR
jgi:hypothetical protein